MVVLVLEWEKINFSIIASSVPTHVRDKMSAFAVVITTKVGKWTIEWLVWKRGSWAEAQSLKCHAKQSTSCCTKLSNAVFLRDIHGEIKNSRVNKNCDGCCGFGTSLDADSFSLGERFQNNLGFCQPWYELC